MWGKKSAPFMQALHFSFALGAFIAPLLASSFIASGQVEGSLYNMTNMTTATITPTTANTEPQSHTTSHSISTILQSKLPERITSKTDDTPCTCELSWDCIDSVCNCQCDLGHFCNGTVDKCELHLTYNDNRCIVQCKLTVLPTPVTMNTSSPTSDFTNLTIALNTSTLNTAVNSSALVPDAMTQNNTFNSSALVPDAMTQNNTFNSSALVPDAMTQNNTFNSSALVPDAMTQNNTFNSSALVPDAMKQNDTFNSGAISVTATSNVTSTLWFVTNEGALTSDGTIIDTSSESTFTSENTTNEVKLSSLVVDHFQKAYILIALFLIAVALLFMYFFYTSPLQGTISGSNERGGTVNLTPADKYFTSHILGLLFVFYFLYVGAEVGFGSYIYTFAIDEDTVKFQPKTATHLNSLFWGSFATMRGVSIFIASVVSPLTMLTIDILGCLVSSAALSYEADTNATVLWVGTAVLGASMASLFPAGISWLESHVSVTSKMASLLIIGSAFGEMAIPIILGNLFDHESVGPMSLMYLIFGVSFLTAAILGVTVYLAAAEGKDVEGPEPTDQIPVIQILEGVKEAMNTPDTGQKSGPGQTARSLILKKSHKE